MSKAKRTTSRRANERPGRFLSTPVLLLVAGVLLLAAALFALWRTGGRGATGSDTGSSPAGGEVSAGPRLKVDREKVDLGDVPLDQTVSVTFQLTNVGDETLRFSQEPYIEVVEGC